MSLQKKLERGCIPMSNSYGFTWVEIDEAQALREWAEKASED